MVGKTYLLRGEPVKVLARWAGNGCPKNVLLEREDGSRTVRPFRGLRSAGPPERDGSGVPIGAFGDPAGPFA